MLPIQKGKANAAILRPGTILVSHSAPAGCRRSPSPVESMTTFARIACLPDLFSMKTPLTVFPSTMGRAPHEWRYSFTPASSIMVFSSHFMISGSVKGGVQHSFPADIQIVAYVEPGEVRIDIMLDQFFVRGTPVFLFRVIRRSPGVQPVDQFLADAGYLLLPAYVAQVRNDGDQSAGSHASQVAVPFHQHRICAAAGRGQRRSDSSRPAAHNNDVGFPADFNISGRFGNCLSCLNWRS